MEAAQFHVCRDIAVGCPLRTTTDCAAAGSSAAFRLTDVRNFAVHHNKRHTAGPFGILIQQRTANSVVGDAHSIAELIVRDTLPPGNEDLAAGVQSGLTNVASTCLFTRS